MKEKEISNLTLKLNELNMSNEGRTLKMDKLEKKVDETAVRLELQLNEQVKNHAIEMEQQKNVRETLNAKVDELEQKNNALEMKTKADLQATKERLKEICI